jgi:DNA-binding NarL/FixJ family response regulator
MAAEITPAQSPDLLVLETDEKASALRAAARTNVARTERLRALVLEVLAAASAGLTADEIAAKLAASVLAVRPRVSELFHAGQIVKTGERRTNASGLRAYVWKKPATGAI